MGYNFYQIAWMFLIYSIIGWLWETPYVSIKLKKFVNRGFLRGPVVPIYGFGATTIMLSVGAIERHLIWHPVVNTILTMLYIAVVASVWEYGTSYIMEGLFKTRWWDYTSHRFNVKGRIALDVSVFWGIGGFILWYFVNGVVLNVYEMLSEQMVITILATSYAIIALDAVTTLIELINLRNLVIMLHEASEDVIGQLTSRIEQLSENLEDFSENLSENIADQRASFLHAINEAKASIKTKAQYRKYEGFQAFSEFRDEMKVKWKSLVDESDISISRFSNSLTRFSDLLGKTTGQKRFFNNYPNATTKQFELIYMNRRKEDALNKNKNETENKK